MTKRFDVLTIMDLCVDTLLYGSDLVPQFGQVEKLIQGYNIEMGGSCSIFACQAAKLDLRTAGVGTVGQDFSGSLILKTLSEAGVSLDFVTESPEWMTGFSVALCTPNDRAILTYEGTIDAVGPADIPERLLMETRHIHIGSYYLLKMMQPHWIQLITKAKSYGVTLSLDTNWDPSGNWEGGIQELLPFVDIFMPNEAELKAIAKADSVDESLSKLLPHIPIIALKRGADGASVYVRNGETYHADSIKVQVVDAVGAGDNFDAGFIYGYLSGQPIEKCLEIGCYCGSMSTRKSGGVAAQVRQGELQLH